VNVKASSCFVDQLLVEKRFSLTPALPAPHKSCEKIEHRLPPGLSVRRSARSTQMEHALRARFYLRIRRWDGSAPAQFNSYQGSNAKANAIHHPWRIKA
jgi:hypothetical protein